ncbi:CHRD domain-containing protein [Natronomonas sp. EA1]|uniref:CHRD domain-containing protein n=1 Tax=Natronomonas sp. EA1 TaxID=3421655 RepID=UPI003EBE6D07
MTTRRETLKLVGVSALLAPAVSGTAAAGEVEKELDGHVFATKLMKGANEVPPVESPASGFAALHLTEHGAGPHIHFAVVVAKLKKAVAAHLHDGAKGENGPVLLTLFDHDHPVTTNGLLAHGTITPEMAGEETFAKAVKAMKAGKAYVNIHTTTYPAGEIRGQVKERDELEVEFEESFEVSLDDGELEAEAEVTLSVNGMSLEMAEMDDADEMDD